MCNPYAYAALQFGQQYFQYQADKAYAADVNARTDAAAARTREEAIYKDISLQNVTPISGFFIQISAIFEPSFSFRYF